MKKICSLWMLLLAAWPLAAENNIRMVTYFPVPYASYVDLGVTGSCDTGLLENCYLDAGEGINISVGENDDRALNTGSLIATEGVLDLDSSLDDSLLMGESLIAGEEDTAGTGILEFSHDLTVSDIDSDSLASAQAQNTAYLENLTLFGEEFPLCDADDNEISWQTLTINGESAVFLVCGTGEQVVQSCEENPDQESCCSGCETWDGSSCVEKTCSSGYTLNSSTCECEVEKGVWTTEVFVGSGWRCDENCNVIFDPDATYTVPTGSCTIGDVRYVVSSDSPLFDYSCTSLGSNSGKCLIGNWQIADMTKYVCVAEE